MIDWACHANDAMATIGDMLDFDAAIGKAIAFYNKYPNDTLIVVHGAVHKHADPVRRQLSG